MIIPFAETVGQQGPTENAFGLDEMTRYFIGAASLYPAFRLTILPGTIDAEFPHMRVSQITPMDLDGTGNLKRVSVQYVGSVDGANGKDPGTEWSTGVVSESRQLTATRTMDKLVSTESFGGMVLEARYETHTDTVTGNSTVQYDTPRITFRYARPYMVKSPEFEAEAIAALAGYGVEVKANRFVADEKWPTVTALVDPSGVYPSFKNSKIVVGDVDSTRVVRLASGGLTSRPRGVWFENDETWEVSFE